MASATIAAVCPHCSKKVEHINVDKPYDDDNYVIVKGERLYDKRIPCGYCRNEFCLSQSPNLIFKEWY